jgi:hypothetical protein
MKEVKLKEQRESLEFKQTCPEYVHKKSVCYTTDNAETVMDGKMD